LILIASASYCREDIAVEIGSLPPSFLPIGNQRLFELQYLLLQNIDEEIWLSLPEGFEIPSYEIKKLESLNIRIIIVPKNLSLCESLTFCIKHINPASYLRILFGDTNFSHLPSEYLDVITVDLPNDDSRWGFMNKNIVEKGKVVSGYFCFSQLNKILRYLKEYSEDFIEALNSYCLDVNTKIIESQDWQDFGHRNQYFKNKANLFVPRYFNKISSKGIQLVKSSSKIEKITSEYEWYKSLPLPLSIHTPRLYSDLKVEYDNARYELEIIPSFSLNEMLVFGNISDQFWEKLFYKIKDILTKFYHEANIFKNDKVDVLDLKAINSSLYLEKTLNRISLYEQSSAQDFSEYRKIAIDAARNIPATSTHHLTISHGDMCFSNVLYCSHNDRIYLIDPRGSNMFKCHPLAGDIRYDIAKLYHSLFCGYDYIIANRFLIEQGDIKFYPEDNAKIDYLSKKFDQLIINGFLNISLDEILAINILLFISMVPLHNDNKKRQKAFLLNSKRLYKELLKQRKK
jgi:hypothetical protein